MTTRLLFCENWSETSLRVQTWKKNRNKNCSSIKCYFGHVECSSNIPVEILAKKPKTSCSLSKKDENFHLFSKTVFFSQNDCIDTKNAVLTGRLNFPAQLPELIRKKSTKSAKTFQNFFSSKCSNGEVESSLKDPLTFFDSQLNFFCSIFKKITICKFCKKLSPEGFHWNRESTFDNPATFFARFGQKNRSVSKKEKKLETKVSSLKSLFWTRRMQF